jgi:DNA-binding transcriptional regulator YiaG
MASSLSPTVPARHLLTSEMRPEMVKADLRKPEIWRIVGGAVERTRVLSGLSLKEFAARFGRDERQVARWISGEERPQVDAVFACEALRSWLVIALAELAGPAVEVETVIRARRRA